MLRLALLLLTVLPLLSCGGQAQSSAHTDTTGTDSAIRAVLATQAAAWNRGDVKTYMQGYQNSPELLFVGKDVRRGYEPVLARYLERYPDSAHMGQLTFSNVEVHPAGPDHAWVLGQWHLQRTAAGGGDVGGWYTLVFQRTGGSWKIIVDHTS